MASASLVIPIEIKVRELHSKSLLAACAAEAGFQVIIGDQRVIASSLHQLPRGIYVDKSISRTKISHFHRLRQLGFSIVAWCEEGLVYRDKAAYQTERVCTDSMSQIDAFFAWGEAQRQDVLEIVPHAQHKVHAHGNPRLDLLRSSLRDMFEDDTRALVSRHGPFILVNTNFSRYNRFRGRESISEVLRTRDILKTPEQEAFYGRFVEHLGAVFHAFAEMIPRLAACFPDRTIIVRPHPSEDHDRWRELLAPISNVRVFAEGIAVPWLMAAETVVHNACTTGVEAYLLDRPTIAYVPVVDQIFNRLTYLPNALSDIALTAEQVIEKLQAIRNGAAQNAETMARKRKVLEQHVAGTSGALATERIVRTLIEIERQSRPNEPGRWQQASTRLWCAARQKAARVRRAIRQDKVLAAYMDQKFPKLNLDELETVLGKIATMRGQAGPLRVTMHPHLASCFVVTSEQPFTQPHQEEAAPGSVLEAHADSVAAEV